ncbi:hypothetical protein DFJ73DRAFT_755653 [Zopfochytrium polystomum]|nr:hypothetical protein DFJ73DRAFT_755653 [Zopfochytrium polystomum]
MESCVRHLRFAVLQWLCEGFPEAAAAHPMLAGFRPMLGMLARSGARTAVETMDFAVSRGSLDSVVWLRHCFGGVDAALELRAAEVVEHEAWRHISMESELEDSSSMQEDT